MAYTAEATKFSYPVVYANKAAFDAREANLWAENRIESNKTNIRKLSKKMENPRYAEYVGEIIEEIEEMQFYNKFLPDFAKLKYEEFLAEGGIINTII